jgi:hypothetical protein
VLLALMALQFRRYPASQVFAFDFGGSIRAAALAMGGDWHDLGGALPDDASDTSVALQPLARIDDRRAGLGRGMDRRDPDAREDREITPEAKEHLWSALTSLASAPIGERTLTGLAVLLQSNPLKQAPCNPIAWAVPTAGCSTPNSSTSVKHRSRPSRPKDLIGTGAALRFLPISSTAWRTVSMVADLAHRRRRLARARRRGFAGQLREWLKTLRKKNASVIFATQSLSDIDGSAIAPAIIESCPTRIFLPNERAIEPQITAIYRRFGLNDRQIEILSRAMPKRDYYCQSAAATACSSWAWAKSRSPLRRFFQDRSGGNRTPDRRTRPRRLRARLARIPRRVVGH